MKLTNTIKTIHRELTDEQLLTIKSNTALKCILASAGSGKTKTIVHHIANDIITGTKPEEIIAFTFTNKAADEILHRVVNFCKDYIPDINLDGIFIGTIHSWCFNLLSEKQDFLNYSALDELNEYSLISRLYDDLELSTIYSEKYPVGIFKFIEDIEIYYNEHLRDIDIPTHILPVIKKYNEILKDNRLMNFGSMLKNAINILDNSEGLPNLKSLYVDEYQDVNPAQVKLIKYMINNGTKLTVVGDELQCIYNWRGSDIERILNFKNDFPNSEIFHLNYNYRSIKPIIDCSNTFASFISNRDKSKKMIPVRESLVKSGVVYLSCDDNITQAETIVNIIRNFHEANIPYNNIAILLRSVVNSSKEIIDALERSNIPIQSPFVGRAKNFIFDFIIPLFHWLSDDLRDPKNEEEENEQENRANAIWLASKNYFKSEVKESYFWRVVNEWKNLLEVKSNDAYNIRKCLYALFDACNIKVDKNDNQLMVAIGILSQIIRSVEEIHRRRLKNRKRKNIKNIYKECTQAIKYNYIDFGESAPIQYFSDGVIITTVHQAKGLEWPIVIMPMLNRNKFPVPERKQRTSFSNKIAGRYGTSLEDEKRLFYVALTRAKDRLILLDSSSNKSKFSDFLLNNYSFQDRDYDSIHPIYWQIPIESLSNISHPIRLGLSDILMFLDCPYQFGLRRKVGIQPIIGDELGFGKGLHEIIQRRFLDKKEWNDKELNEQIDKHVHIPYQSEDAEKKSKKSILERFKILDLLGVFKHNIIAEEKVEVILNNGIIDGNIDGIIQNSDKTVTIVDWKSNIHDEYLQRYENQLRFYSYGLVMKGYKIKQALIIDVAGSYKANKIISHQVDISNNKVEDFINKLNLALKKITEDKFDPIANEPNCSCCDVLKLCSYKL